MAGVSEDDGDLLFPSEHNRKFSQIGQRIQSQSFELPQYVVPKRSDAFWLPIDQYLINLGNRKRSPKLLSPEELVKRVPILSTMSVHIFVRAHLGICFSGIASQDPANRAKTKAQIEKFLISSAEVSHAVVDLLDTSEDKWIVPIFDQGLPTQERSLRYYFGIAVRRNLIQAAADLKLIEAWAISALDEVSPEFGGRPRVDWKHDFVARLAHTWELITGRPPSPKIDGPFAEFISACWLSGGEELPEISFDRTIRSVAKDWPASPKGDKTFNKALWLSSSFEDTDKGK